MSEFERMREATSLQEYAEAYLERVGGGYVCPNPECRSGAGPKHTPALKIYQETQRWYCHACQTGGDIFDMAGLIHNATDKGEQLRLVAEWANIPLEGKANGGGFNQARAKSAGTTAQGAGKAAPDYTQGRIEEAAKVVQWRADLWKHPEAIAYLKGRGFPHGGIEG